MGLVVQISKPRVCCGIPVIGIVTVGTATVGIAVVGTAVVGIVTYPRVLESTPKYPLKVILKYVQ